MVVRVVGEVKEVGGGFAVVVVGAIFVAGVVVAVAAAVVEALEIVAVVTGKVVVSEVVVFVVVIPGFLHDGANPIEARVMPLITIPAFSKNSLRLRASRKLFFSLRISFSSIAGLVSFWLFEIMI